MKWLSKIFPPLLFVIPAALAQGEIASLLTSINTFNQSLGISENPFFTLVRIGLIILMALILSQLLSLLGLQKTVSGGIAFILAIISGYFLPSSLLAAIFSTYALLFSIVLIGIPVGIILFVLYGGFIPDSAFGRLARIFLLIILIALEVWILTWL